MACVTVVARVMDNRINFPRTGHVWIDLIEIETSFYDHCGVRSLSDIPRVHTAWWRTH